jgi:hypothetical protein
MPVSGSTTQLFRDEKAVSDDTAFFLTERLDWRPVQNRAIMPSKYC